MTSATFSDFLTPFPLVTVTNQLILFLPSAFWGTPPTHCGRHTYGSPPTPTEVQSNPLFTRGSKPATQVLVASRLSSL